MFDLLKSTELGRHGKLSTQHGPIDTPFFLPVGTCGAMKGLTHQELVDLGAQVLLCNTYHLHLQPGEKVVEEAGGLHEFIGWDKPILTDSGGFQVFSLKAINEITDAGVHFRSHLNGDPLFLGPEESMRIQHALGSDIIMCFDQCPPSTALRAEQVTAVERTLRWAKECKRWHDELKRQRRKKRQGSQKNDFSFASSDSLASFDSFPLLFGIVQGGLEPDLRERCARELVSIGFDGYAIGGLAVGETEEEMYRMLDVVCPLLPPDKPRYLMGVGRIEQMRRAIAKGIDMFDCVLPMREARHGTIWMSDGSKIRVTNSEFRNDHSVIDAHSPSPLGRMHKKSYLHHLLRAQERLGETIACSQNLGITLTAIRDIRTSL